MNAPLCLPPLIVIAPRDVHDVYRGYVAVARQISRKTLPRTFCRLDFSCCIVGCSQQLFVCKLQYASMITIRKAAVATPRKDPSKVLQPIHLQTVRHLTSLTCGAAPSQSQSEASNGSFSTSPNTNAAWSGNGTRGQVQQGKGQNGSSIAVPRGQSSASAGGGNSRNGSALTTKHSPTSALSTFPFTLAQLAQLRAVAATASLQEVTSLAFDSPGM
jgi:hypothetical protein